jgi:hypothetical protein
MLASRSFTMADQIRFATVSGDHNPMHIDVVFARRTQAGEPAVHGIHLLLWALDVLARANDGQPAIRRLTARFNRFVAVDEMVAAVPAKRNEANARFDLVVDILAAGLTVAQITVDYGRPAHGPNALFFTAVSAPADPYNLAFEEMEGLSGRLAFASAAESAAAMFPALSGWLGSRRVAALAASSLLVGMVCPGLHSIYGSLAVDVCDEKDPEDRLDFRVVSADPRFRLVRSAIVGGGLYGTVESLLRVPPVRQESSHDLIDLVGPGEFASGTALVVGGSRGLGEVTGKLLAMGGAKVVITYRVGRTEADAVVDDIRAAGGTCDLLAYDASKAAGPQLSTLGDAPTHAYYFASPTIFRAQSALFARARLDAFLNTYVDGFLDLAQALRARRRDVSLFYPSSEFVEERPRGMIEYAMAKAAGETLCSEMNLTWAPLHVTVERLPRLLTDQTASIIGTRFASSAERLLPVVRQVQSRSLQAA